MPSGGMWAGGDGQRTVVTAAADGAVRAVSQATTLVLADREVRQLIVRLAEKPALGLLR
jgi:hypothetical protein